MANFLGPSYDAVNINTAESLYGPSIIYKNSFLNFDSTLALRDNSIRSKVAGQFIVNASGNIVAVDLFLKKVGTPLNDLTVALYSSVSNLPSGAVLATSNAFAINDVASDTWTRARFTFPTPVAVVAGSTYFWSLESTYAISATNYVNVAVDLTPSVPQRGAIYNGSAWSALGSLPIMEVFFQEQGKVAMSFIATGNQRLDSVHLWLSKTGAPTGNLFVEIVEDLNDAPSFSGPTNNISNAVAAASLSSSYGDVTFTFFNPPSLNDGQKYHIVLSATGSLSVGNNINVGVDTASPSFSGNNLSRTNNDGTWYVYTGIDAAFEVYYLDQALPSTLANELASLGTPPTDCRQLQVWLTELTSLLSTFYPTITPSAYGGTGTGKYNKGDMLYASSPNHLEKLPIGVYGENLAVGPDGTPVWGGAGNVVIQTYYNNSGVQLNPGESVITDFTIENAVTTTVVKNHPAFAGIVQNIIPIGEFGPVLTHGVTDVRVSETVATGDALTTSTIVRRAGKSDGFVFANMVALEAGVSGDMVKTFVNVSRANYQRSFGSWSPSGNLGGTTYAAILASRITIPVYTGRVMVSFQGGVQNSSAAAGIPALNIAIDGVILALSGSNADLWRGALEASADNGYKEEAHFHYPIIDLTPGTHFFELAAKQSAGSWFFNSQPQENERNHMGATRGLFWVQEF